MKHISVLTLFALLTIWAGLAMATGKNNYTDITNNYIYNYDNDTTTITSGVSDNDLAEAVATAAACSGSFYMGSTRPQGRVDWASYDGKQKLCFQGAIRPGESTNVQVDFGIVPDNDPDKALYRAGFLVIF